MLCDIREQLRSEQTVIKEDLISKQVIGSLDFDISNMDLEELCIKFSDASRGLKCDFYFIDYTYRTASDIQSIFVNNLEEINLVNPEYIVAILDYFWVKNILDIIGEENLYWLSNIYDDVKGAKAFKKRLEADMYFLAESDICDDVYRSYLHYLADVYYTFSEPYITGYEVLVSKVSEFSEFITEHMLTDREFVNSVLYGFKEDAGEELWGMLLDNNIKVLESCFYYIDEDLLVI